MTKNQPFSVKILMYFILKCIGLISTLSIVIILLFFDVVPKTSKTTSKNVSNIFYMNYDVSSIKDINENDILKYGFDLFEKTPKYIGPDNGNSEMIFSGNRLACKNCHLNFGTKPYSAPLIGIVQRFPQFRGRENKIGTIEERINGCMERSMNGNALPTTSKEMKAIIAYLEWLSRHAPDDGKLIGTGFLKIKIPNRAINLNHGEAVFKANCIVCHGTDGQGVKSNDGYTYTYPPLWGEDSYNDGAGMTRVITAAQFIKGNMPYGTSYNAPILTDEEAYDVAGYINQQERPNKNNPERDFPDLKKKPVSTPYPPYADNFPIEQHQKGPFQPIIKYYKESYNIIKTK